MMNIVVGLVVSIYGDRKGGKEEKKTLPPIGFEPA
jgi:hypothetical protein